MTDAPGYLIGLIGSGIGPSLSPPLHQAEAQASGVRYLYRRLDLAELGLPPSAVGELVRVGRLVGFDGLNITHPCKRLVIEHLDALSEESAALNAVNTVVYSDGKAIGHNTDWSGFAHAFDRGLPDAATNRVVLLGAGGAGAAVAYALLTLGTKELCILDSDDRQSASLAEAMTELFGEGRARAAPSGNDGGELVEALAASDGVVHATPTGMAEHPGSPVPPESLRPEMWVAEVVYRPLETELITTARARGCRVLDGGRMAVFQAAEAFRLFTGITPDGDRMLRHFAGLVEAEGNHATH